MNSFLPSLYPGDSALLLAADVAVQIAGVVVVALAVGWTVARRNAAVRHAVCLGALVWVCLSPFAAWGLRRAGVTLWRVPVSVGAARPVAKPQAATGGPAPVEGAGGTVGFAAPSSGGMTDAPLADAGPLSAPLPAPSSVTAPDGAPAPAVVVRPPLPRPNRTLETVAGAATVVWAAGAVCLLARLGAGLVFVARVRRDLMPADGVVGDDILLRVRRTLGVTTLPPVWLSRRLRGPAAVGLWRPVVVLPADLAAGMSAAEQHDAVAHECGHALRRDGAVAVLQRVAGAVFWLHLLVPLLNRALARAREEVCDNLVLRGTPPAAYARTLLALAERSRAAGGAVGVGLLDGTWRLEHRVAGLLHARRIVMTRINKRTNVAVAAVVTIVGAALAAVGTIGPATVPVRPPAEGPKAEVPVTRAPTERSGNIDVRNAPFVDNNAASAESAAAMLSRVEKSEMPLVLKVREPLTDPSALAIFDRFPVEYVYTDFKGDGRAGRTRAVADQVRASAQSKEAFVINFHFDAKTLAEAGVPTTQEAAQTVKLEQVARESERSRLDLREAEIKVESDDRILSRLQAASTAAKTTAAEIENAKTTLELDRIRVDRARLLLDEARAKVRSLTPPVSVFIRGPGRPSRDQYPLNNQTNNIEFLLYRRHDLDMTKASEIHVAQMRKSHFEFRIPLSDLISGKVHYGASLWSGDEIWVWPMAAAVQDWSGGDSELKTVWLQGRTLTVGQLLTETGVDLGSSKGTEIDFYPAPDGDGPRSKPWNDTLSLRDVVEGKGREILDVPIQPGDRIEIR